ncbi:MAG: hypothetical protein U0931_33335 [Vulcanimicrobiota bacterium]
MQSHRQIEQRSLAMISAIVHRIDQDPQRTGLLKARANCRRWPASAALQEWERLLEKPWEEIRLVLLDPGEEGCRLRQNDPFVGILTPQERWEFYRS